MARHSKENSNTVTPEQLKSRIEALGFTMASFSRHPLVDLSRGAMSGYISKDDYRSRPIPDRLIALIRAMELGRIDTNPEGWAVE